MDKHTTFNTLNNMLGKKHSYTLPFSDEARELICKHDSAQMYKIMISLYAERSADEELVKTSIASFNKETMKPIGFGYQKD